MKGWIGVDFDGTLAVFRGNGTVLGEPILPMVARVRAWLRLGHDVRIFTSRGTAGDEDKREAVKKEIQGWCRVHLGKELPITNQKDMYMTELWDDKAITVIKNTGLSWREYQRRVTHTRKRAGL